MRPGRSRTVGRLCVGLALAASLALGSCRSSRIESGSANSSLSTRRSEVLDLLAEAERRVGVTAYKAKNAKAAVVLKGGEGVKVRANISFATGGETTLAARLAFPPVSVGTVTVGPRRATISSKYLGNEKSVALPDFANAILQAALLGNLPPVYRYFGESDFSRFAMYLNADDTYELSRSETGVSVKIGVRGADKTLAYARVGYGKHDVSVDVAEYRRFDGNLLPSRVKVTLREPDSSVSKLDIEISDVTLQEK